MSSSTVTPERAPVASMLQLVFDIDAAGHYSASIPVRWCANPDRLAAALRRRGFKKPHVLVCVRSVHEEGTYGGNTATVYRDYVIKVEPIDRLMTFVGFRRSGLNQVLAVVVDVADSQVAAKLKRWSKRGKSPNFDSIFDERGFPNKAAFREQYTVVPYISVNAARTVNVDPQLLGKERPEWQRKMVRLFFEGKERDECDFRKRFWFFSLEAFALLVLPATLVKSLWALFLSFLGMRYVNYRTLLDPFRLWPNVVHERIGESRYYFKKPEKGRYSGEWQYPVWMVINPPVLLVPAGLIYLIFLAFVHSDRVLVVHTRNFWSVLLWTNVALAMLLVLIAVLVGVVAGLIAVSAAVTGSSSWQERQAKRKREEVERADQELVNQLRILACETGPAVASLKALPASKRSFRLLFLDVKSRVCRPMPLD